MRGVGGHVLTWQSDACIRTRQNFRGRGEIGSRELVQYVLPHPAATVSVPVCSLLHLMLCASPAPHLQRAAQQQRLGGACDCDSIRPAAPHADAKQGGV